MAESDRSHTARTEELAGPATLPVRAGERYATLDILRGFALLGILALNIEDFAGPESLWDIPIGTVHAAFVGWHAKLDLLIVAIKWMFFEGKMRGVFAMLFGAGVVLFTERLERRRPATNSADIFYRRNLWLLVFGLIHGLFIWFGDILVDYAVLGLLFLYPLRHVSPKKLIGAGAALWLAGSLFGAPRALHVAETVRAEAQLRAATAAGPSASPQQRALIAADAQARLDAPGKLAEAVRTGREGYVQGWSARASEELDFLVLKFRSGWILEWLGAMVTGMGLYKVGFLTGRRSARTYVLVAVAGYAVCLPVVLLGLTAAVRSGFDPAVVAETMIRPYGFQVVAGALANASLVLLAARAPALARGLSPLGAVGRTAFSNYIMTSVVCRFLFSWGPFKLYGALEYYQTSIVVVLIWVLNLALSTIWLRSFAFGPLEWLWRSLTYWKRQPFRRLHGREA